MSVLSMFLPTFRSAFLSAALILAAGIGHAGDGRLGRDDARWLERVTYGLDTATVARLREIGRKRFLEEQLAPLDETLPKSVQAQIDALDISKIPATKLVADEVEAQQRIRAMPDGEAKQQARKAREELGNEYAYQAMRRHLLRAVYSPAQLKEQMDWFWLNHFSVFARKAGVRWLAADYEERAIRPHALGNFRDLVMATLTHPAMLQYLDNAQNAVGHVNENYARELMELHTLGVDAGYTQTDVQELARVLTGVGIARPDAPARPAWRHEFVSDGLFAFYPARHDFGPKTLLGEKIRGHGFAEVEEAVDLLVSQPACARFVSRKIAEYFVADTPPPALVEAMARTFQSTHGNIAAVLRTMFESHEFEASLGGKFKDPMHYVVSSVRLAYDGKPIANERPLVNWLRGQGEMLFGHQSPDGYPLTETAWASSGQLSRRFEIARAIGSGTAGLFVPENGGPPGSGFPNLSNHLFFEAIQPYLSKATIVALDAAKSPQEWNAFLLASPEFNYR
ncbi:MAG TPA: DUF1800 domain-containing protein [Rudaea sp.]|nr:DUF1800 domain-containing protein [Rudaea sp.]